MHPTSTLRVVMLVQKVDANDWLLGFAVGWIQALAARVQRLDVIALENRSNPAALPANVHIHSLGKERQVGRLRELVTFQHQLATAARRADVIFSHLTPRYTWLAAPWAAVYHVPQCLWYTHRQASRELRWAMQCSRWIVTAASDSFPLPSPKRYILGHGIDTRLFAPGDTQPDADPPLVLAVGRLAPIKRHDVLLEAAALLRERGISANFAVAGGVASPEGTAYRAQLEARIAELHLGDQFRLLGGVGRDDLAHWYQRAAVVTNLSPPGLFDKAALEAMATARPTLVTNPAFDDLLGDYRTELYLTDPPEPSALADKLAGLLSQPSAERTAIGAALRQRTIEAHSLDQLMDRLVRLWQQ